jgi:hypothetical protein
VVYEQTGGGAGRVGKWQWFLSGKQDYPSWKCSWLQKVVHDCMYSAFAEYEKKYNFFLVIHVTR